MKHALRTILAFGLVAMATAAASAQPAEPQEGCDYYEETGHNLCEPFQEYWMNNGALPVFGYPITEAADEFIIDRQDEYLTQYFERERMEHHPALAGSPYEILLGRLGNEVLLEMGRDWFTFPEGDPNDDHYFAETGHAIGDEFWAYWSSHGLDLGDEGVSFAESLALFGYPLSEPAMETNASGDTVLTQWFERARFELHGDQVLLGLLGNELLELRNGGEEPPPPPTGEVIAEGLEAPRGIDVAADGTVYVSESGVGGDDCVAVPGEEGEEFELCFGNTGQVTQIAGGEQSVALAGLTSLDLGGDEYVGPQDVVIGDGVLYVQMGLGADPAERFEVGDLTGDLGWIVAGTPDGETERLADVAAYEGVANPDDGVIDSNPFSLVQSDDGSWIVSDAGANALLHVQGSEVTTLAVFEPRMVEAPPFLELPEGTEIPMESVPTGATIGPDGAVYVGELTGFPFEPGMARVWRVTANGEASVYADGFTNVIDVAFDGAGNLYVLEMVAGGLLNADPSDPASAASQIIKVSPDGAQEVIASDGLIFATGLGLGPDGTIYVSNFGVMPGMGQVVAISDVAEPIPSGPELSVVASGLNNPRGLFVDEAGDLYIAQAGIGGDICEPGTSPEGDEVEVCVGATGTVELINADGQQSTVSGISSIAYGQEVTGAHDMVLGSDGLLHIVVGLGSDPAARAELPVAGSELGWVITAAPGTSPLLSADIAAYEGSSNPDGGDPAEGGIDSNPFSIVEAEDGWVVSDAGANALLHVDDGGVSTLAVFEPQLVDAPPFLGLPEGAQIPMESVPTGVVMGPDGAYYVGELTGFPFEPGMARVWRVTADGEASVYASGFTNVVDLAFDSAGNLFVLELAKNGLLSDDVTSAVVQVMDDGNHAEVASFGLTFATGMAIGPDDTFYVSNFGVMPEMGQVVSFTLE